MTLLEIADCKAPQHTGAGAQVDFGITICFS